MNISSQADYDRSLNIQKPRDVILRRAMLAANIPNFPLPLEQALAVYPFLKEITSHNRSLSILLIYKIGTRKVKYVIINNGNDSEYSFS
jgi:hypothetical protein